MFPISECRDHVFLKKGLPASLQCRKASKENSITDVSGIKVPEPSLTLLESHNLFETSVSCPVLIDINAIFITKTLSVTEQRDAVYNVYNSIYTYSLIRHEGINTVCTMLDRACMVCDLLRSVSRRAYPGPITYDWDQ